MFRGREKVSQLAKKDIIRKPEFQHSEKLTIHAAHA